MFPHYYSLEGTAIPQGSKTATVINGRAVMFDSNKKLKDWRREATRQISEQFRSSGLPSFPAHNPVGVVIIFRLPKPKTAKRDKPTTKPDLDKLVRSIFDSATDAGIWAGDEQVVQVNACKEYCRPDEVPNVIFQVYNKTVTE